MKKCIFSLFFAILFLFCSCTVNQPQNDGDDVIGETQGEEEINNDVPSVDQPQNDGDDIVSEPHKEEEINNDTPSADQPQNDGDDIVSEPQKEEEINNDVTFVDQPQYDDGDIILGYMSFQNGNDIYYIEPAERKAILKNSNNKITTLLSSDNIIADMLFYNGKIYYCEKYGIKLYAVDLDGKNAELILDGESTENFYGSEFFSWCIYENNLYLNCNIVLYKINLETHEWEVFNNDVSSAYQFFDGHLYYIDHAERTFTIYKQNIETKNIEIFIGEGISRPVNNIYADFVISPDGTFYIFKRVPSELISYKGGVLKVIDTAEKFEDGFSLMYYKEQLYYVKVTDGQYYLYRYDCNADSITEIGVLDNYKRAIFINEDYYYYSSEHIATKDSLIKVELNSD